MKQVLVLVLVGGLLFAAAYVFISPPGEQQESVVDPVAGVAKTIPLVE